MPIKPITPDQAQKGFNTLIPDGVISAFNELIMENWREASGRSTFTQDAVIARIQIKMSVERQAIFDRGWLDVENRYRSGGWVVEYDKPGYSETYKANFTFKKRPSMSMMGARKP